MNDEHIINIDADERNANWTKKIWDLPTDPRVFIGGILWVEYESPVRWFLYQWESFERSFASQAMPEDLRDVVEQVADRVEAEDPDAPIGPLIRDIVDLSVSVGYYDKLGDG